MSSNRYLMPHNTGEILPDHFQEFLSEVQFVYTPVTPDGPVTPLNARLLYVSTAKYERDWHSAPHAHSFTELFYIVRGKGEFSVKGRSFPIEKNHLVIINPQIEHAEFSSEEQPLEYIVLGIEGLQFDPFDQEPEEVGVIHFTQVHRSTVHYLQALLEEVENDLVGHEVVCQSLLNVILIQILRHKELKLSISASGSVNASCRTVKDYLDVHFKEPLTLEILAQQAHQNKYYVAHTFKNAYGVSPMRYLINRRVDESKFLLSETDVSVGQIASITGFSSASHFAQAFRRIAGMTPKEYRKKFHT